MKIICIGRNYAAHAEELNHQIRGGAEDPAERSRQAGGGADTLPERNRPGGGGGGPPPHGLGLTDPPGRGDTDPRKNAPR